MDEPVLGFSYQYQQSYLLSGNLGWDDARRIPYMPAHIWGVSLEIPWNTAYPGRSGSLLISVHHESLRYADVVNLLRLEPYTLLNLTCSQQLGNFTAFAVLRNALNTHYTSFAEYPMPGISLTAGLRWLCEKRPEPAGAL
jgi:outer membrane receptor protein involved in Fe transport